MYLCLHTLQFFSAHPFERRETFCHIRKHFKCTYSCDPVHWHGAIKSPHCSSWKQNLQRTSGSSSLPISLSSASSSSIPKPANEEEEEVAEVFKIPEPPRVNKLCELDIDFMLPTLFISETIVASWTASGSNVSDTWSDLCFIWCKNKPDAATMSANIFNLYLWFCIYSCSLFPD